jgi:hypothetical protein
MPNLPAPQIPSFPQALLQGSGGLMAPQMSEQDVRSGSVAVAGVTLDAEPNQTYRITVSSAAPNAIASPFEHPKLLTTSPDAVKFMAHGKDLVVTVTSASPVGVYVTGQDSQDPLIGLVLVPKPIPPRNYVLRIPGYVPLKPVPGMAPTNAAGDATARVPAYVDIMKQALAGATPAGFTAMSQGRFPGDELFLGMRLTPVQMWSAEGQDLVVLSATNTTDQPVHLMENDFYARGVLAVAIAPHRDLLRGQTARVYVLRATSSQATDLLGVWK